MQEAEFLSMEEARAKKTKGQSINSRLSHPLRPTLQEELHYSMDGMTLEMERNNNTAYQSITSYTKYKCVRRRVNFRNPKRESTLQSKRSESEIARSRMYVVLNLLEIFLLKLEKGMRMLM